MKAGGVGTGHARGPNASYSSSGTLGHSGRLGPDLFCSGVGVALGLVEMCALNMYMLRGPC